jgi:CHAT domain-containing protein
VVLIFGSSLLFRSLFLALAFAQAALASEADIRRVEASRSTSLSPEERRALFARWLPAYREHAAALAGDGRIGGAFDIAELTKTRTLQELTGVRLALTAARHPKLRELDEARTPPRQELRELLPPGAVYLSYLVQRNVYLVLALSAEHGLTAYRPGLIPNLPATIAAYRLLLAIPPELRAQVAGMPTVWRRMDGSFQAAASTPEAGAVPTDSADDIGAYLGEKLLGPAASYLANAKRIIVSPDAGLAFVPFDALRLKGRYVVERYEVQYTQSAGLYAASKARAAEYAKLTGRDDLLAVGGATYDQLVRTSPILAVHHDLLYGPPDSGPPAAADDRQTSVPQAFKALKISWANLPGTERSAERIAALFERARLLKGPDASEERLRELNRSGELARFRHLLFATHGYLSPREPRLSSVVLSQVGNRGPNDGYVTAAEWPLYDLRSDLAVISASNSGFGPVSDGEGLLALPFALHVAGNRNTVFTLWVLNDAVTAGLVERFFARVRAGADHVSALTEVKREFLSRSSVHHWAAFVLYGS